MSRFGWVALVGYQMYLSNIARARSACRVVVSLFTCVLAIALSGCGASGGGSSGGTVVGSSNGTSSNNQGNSTTLEITTTSLPGGHVETLYAPVSLKARNAQGSLEWALIGGHLPTGIDLAIDGRLIGTPGETGMFHIVVEATDDVHTDTATLMLSVDVFDAHITEGLHFGDAWSGRQVRVLALGADTASFTAPVNASNGSFSVLADGVTALWTPGHVGTYGVVDTLRVTNSATGETKDLQVSVRRDPMAHHAPEFGSTDVWHIDFASKNGAHAYATDYHAALASVGLRAVDSLALEGTPADQLAALYVKLNFLKSLNEMYRRNGDGSAGANGLPISFVVDQPGAGFFKPGAGGWLPGRSDHYSAISVVDTAAHGTVGAALVDEIGNTLHINNAPNPTGTLGVFINRVMPHVRGTYNTSSRSTSYEAIGEDDEAMLLALLHGDAPESHGTRGQDIAYVANAIGRSLAAVAAHEIGHSLGLLHTSSTTPGSIMNYAATIHPAAQYFFLPEDIVHLETSLPGVGRVGGTSSKMANPLGQAAQTPPGNGVHVCGGCCGGH